MRRWIRSWPTAVVLALLLLPGGAQAHEHRRVGAYDLTVGWAEEPPYAGQRNAVQVLVRDAAGHPVTDAGDTLAVQVIYGPARSGRLSLAPAAGRPGDYRAPLIPTRPGTYTFRLVGSIRGQRVDQSFTSSETTFDPVRDPQEIEFPAKDPSLGDLAARVERLTSRVESARSEARGAASASRRAQVLCVLGVLVGAAALGAATLRGRR